MAEELTPELVEEFRQAFALFDKKGVGSINTEELRDLLMLLGMGQSEQEIAKLIKEADDDESGTIDEDEFLALMARLMRDQETEEEIIEAFRPIDEQMDGKVRIETMYDGLGFTPEQKHEMPLEKFRQYIDSVVRVSSDDTIEYALFVRKMLMKK
uniref:EF-hand domain-containing protein n=1 Tax=Neobodo designis TaxID=312471 RepID=A0A7S1Q629_NEODS